MVKIISMVHPIIGIFSTKLQTSEKWVSIQNMKTEIRDFCEYIIQENMKSWYHEIKRMFQRKWWDKAPVAWPYAQKHFSCGDKVVLFFSGNWFEGIPVAGFALIMGKTWTKVSSLMILVFHFHMFSIFHVWNKTTKSIIMLLANMSDLLLHQLSPMIHDPYNVVPHSSTIKLVYNFNKCGLW